MQAIRAPYNKTIRAPYDKKKPRLNPDSVTILKPSKNAKKYQYVELETRQHIRLLCLYPGDGEEPLFCEIVHASLDDRPDYEAVSYVWGDPVTLHCLNVLPNEYLKITHSLHGTLCSLRNANVEDGPRILWIDACCIDQNNVEERSLQVCLMADIYRFASGVITYIGEATADTEEGLKLAGFLFRCADDPSQFVVPPREHTSWPAFRMLLYRPWSTRIWIAQEFALNKNLIMVCGDIIFPWELLPYLLFLDEGARILGLITTEPHFGPIHKKDESVITLKLMSLLRLDMQQGKKLHLLQLLQLCHKLDSSEPRDKVYALLGFACDREQLKITPDYSISVPDILIDVSTRIFRAGKTTSMLGSVLPGKSFRLPSWVPDWTTSAPGSHIILSSREGWCACGSTETVSTIDDSSRTLTLKGTFVDRIAYISERYINYLIFGQDEKMFVWIHEQLRIVKNFERRLPGTGLLEAFWRTLIADRPCAQDETPQWYRVGFIAAFKIWAMGYAQSRRYIGRNTSNAVREVAISADPLLGPGDLDPLSPEQARLGHNYIGSLVLLGRLREFCITEKGLLGLVPSSARINDKIVIFAGGTVPFAVREVANSYELVGEAYVHGIMNGEAFGIGDFSWQDITLF